MRTHRTRCLLVAAALGLAAFGLAPTSVALAAPSATEQREAKGAWEKGKREVARKRWPQAVAAFRDADALHPRAQYKLDLARALVRQGALRDASDVLDELDASKQPDAASARGAGADLREQIERRLATIVVEVKGPSSAVEVKVDQREVKPGEVVRVDPGRHLVRARAQGWVPMEQTVELRERQTEAVAFTLERDPGAAEEAARAAAPANADADAGAGEEKDPVLDDDDGSGTLLPAAIAWGASGAGIALGAVFGVFAFEEAEKARVGCVDNVCPEANSGAIDASRDNGTASTVCFAIGGAGLVTGVVLAIVYGSDDAPPEPPSTGALRLRPIVGPTGAGLVGSFF